MDDTEREENRRKFRALCERSGYPPGVVPGASFRNMPFRGGCILTLATKESAWSEDAHYAALPPTKDSADE